MINPNGVEKFHPHHISKWKWNTDLLINALLNLNDTGIVFLEENGSFSGKRILQFPDTDSILSFWITLAHSIFGQY